MRGRSHPAGLLKQCAYCGRKGTRQFVTIGAGGYLCARLASCERRRRALLAPFKRWAA
jgi:hypothetical protein